MLNSTFDDGGGGDFYRCWTGEDEKVEWPGEREGTVDSVLREACTYMEFLNFGEVGTDDMPVFVARSVVVDVEDGGVGV